MMEIPILEIANCVDNNNTSKMFVTKQNATISITLRADEIKNFNKLGIDFLSQSKNILINQCSHEINKLILLEIFDTQDNQNIILPIHDGMVSFDERDIIKEIDNTLNSYIDNYDFIVVNTKNAANLQDSRYYVSIALSNKTITNGLSYVIGYYKDKPIYADPNMNWTDNRLLLGKKSTSYSFDMEDIKIEDTDPTPPKLQLAYSYSISGKNESIIFNVIDSQESLNSNKTAIRKLGLSKLFDNIEEIKQEISSIGIDPEEILNNPSKYVFL